MRKIRSVGLLFLVLMMLSVVFPLVSAHFRDDRIEVFQYVSYQTEDGGWHDWIGYTMENRSLIFPTLKVGQAIRLKLIATPFEIGSFAFSIDEPGRIKAYDIVDLSDSPEPTYMYPAMRGADFEPIEANTRVEYVYTLIVNGNWTGGSCATVEVYWSIAFKGQPGQLEPEPEDRRDKTFGICGNIRNEQWTGPSYRPSNGQINENGETTSDPSTTPRGIPGFTLSLLFVSLLGFTLYGKKRKR